MRGTSRGSAARNLASTARQSTDGRPPSSVMLGRDGTLPPKAGTAPVTKHDDCWFGDDLASWGSSRSATSNVTEFGGRARLRTTQPLQHCVERRPRGALAQALLDAPCEQPLPDPSGVQTG